MGWTSRIDVAVRIMKGEREVGMGSFAVDCIM